MNVVVNPIIPINGTHGSQIFFKQISQALFSLLRKANMYGRKVNFTPEARLTKIIIKGTEKVVTFKEAREARVGGEYFVLAENSNQVICYRNQKGIKVEWSKDNLPQCWICNNQNEYKMWSIVAGSPEYYGHRESRKISEKKSEKRGMFSRKKTIAPADESIAEALVEPPPEQIPEPPPEQIPESSGRSSGRSRSGRSSLAESDTSMSADGASPPPDESKQERKAREKQEKAAEKEAAKQAKAAEKAAAKQAKADAKAAKKGKGSGTPLVAAAQLDSGGAVAPSSTTFDVEELKRTPAAKTTTRGRRLAAKTVATPVATPAVEDDVDDLDAITNPLASS
jgi:hypothetical protein